MSRQSDHPDGPGTLPPPELNPLLNPLLAENMGRWAQVYFTSPPEKREQAVQELVRELRAEKSARAGDAPSMSVFPPHSPTEIQPEFLECRSCGKKNPASQRFCGMCGTRLVEPEMAAEEVVADETVHQDANLVSAEESAARNGQDNSQQSLQSQNLPEGDWQPQDSQTEDLRPREERTLQSPWQRQAQQQRQGSADDLQSQPIPLEAGRRETHAEHGHSVEPPVRDRVAPVHELQYFAPRRDLYAPKGRSNELSLFQAGNEDYDGDDDASAHRGSARTYVAIVVVLLILILAYLGWRNAHQAPGNSKPPLSYAATDEPATPDSLAANAPASPNATNPSAVPATGNPASSSPSAAETRNTAAPATPARKETTPNEGVETANPTPRPTVNSSAEPTSGSGAGAEELAFAEGYLNGTNGQSRNTPEAAKWLWKAIAKHNAEASFLLSELYLKGDGVPKNCEQARVLLDAATLKGVKGAGERLRHLQAFGCQ